MKLLLVDDEEHVIFGLKKMIDWDRMGLDEVITANDGLKGWELFQQYSPDIVITDMYMPGLNGLEFIRKIRKVSQTIPIIIFSGYDEFQFAKEAIQLNVSRYLLKPMVYREFESVVDEVIRELKMIQRKEIWYEQFERHIIHNLPILREQLLYNMLTIGISNNDLSSSKLRFLELGEYIMDGAMVMCVLIHRPENHERTRSENDWQLFKFAAANIVKEIICKYGNHHVLRSTDDRLPIILFEKNKHNAAVIAQQIADECIGKIRDFLELDTNVGIGGFADRIQHYPISYKEAQEALDESDYAGPQKIFRIDQDRRSLVQDDIEFPIYQIQLLSDAVVRLDRNEVKMIWSEMKKDLFPVMPERSIQAVCQGVFMSVILKIWTINSQISGLDGINREMYDLQKRRTSKELIHLIEIHLEEWLEKLEDRVSGQGSRAYVEQVIRIIEERYHTELSFNDIAKELHLSRRYLSSLFKRHTGKTFTHFLSHYRIQQAQKLFATQQYMIYEVCELVGFSDPSYFSRVFKNIVGKSPSEYIACQFKYE